jgi:hypothetical protein
MDVGATFCRSRRPACDPCPVRAWCRFAAEPAAPAHTRAAAPSAPHTPKPFALTSRWLRGRILDRLRLADDERWTVFADPIGDHAAAGVLAALVAMAADGLVELHALDPARARLPLA